jgi:hypothetical protein
MLFAWNPVIDLPAFHCRPHSFSILQSPFQGRSGIVAAKVRRWWLIRGERPINRSAGRLLNSNSTRGQLQFTG